MAITHKLLSSETRALQKKRRYIQAGLTLCLGIGLSLSIWVVVYSWEEKLLQVELQNQLEKVAINIHRDIKGNLDALQGLAALYSASDEVKEQDFETFVKSAIYRHPSLQAIAWLPRMSDEQRLLYEKTAQTENYPDFQITELTKQGKIVRARQRKEYFPAYYVASFVENKWLPGFDFAADPIYQSALKRAAEQDEIVITGRTQLIEQQADQSIILAFVPIYNQNTPKNSTGKTLNYPSLRRNNLRGFALGIFQINAVMKTALEEVKLDAVNLYLQDAIAPENERFLSFYEAKTQKIVTEQKKEELLKIGQKAFCPDGSGCTRFLSIENRRWLLQLLVTPEFITIQKHWRSWTILIFGTLFTSLVTIYLLILLSYTEQIERVVGERTAQYQQLRQVLQELQQTQAQLVQTEKMSTLGLLVAGVAHEINNPINFIYGNLQYTNDYAQDLLRLVTLYQKYYSNPHPDILDYAEKIDLDFLMEDMPKLLSSMKIGAERILQLVLSLRNFSRLDESEMKAVNIHEGIDSTLLILQNKLKSHPSYPEIEVVKNYGDLPLVECYAGQLNQVFMNIIVNAIDALDSYNLQRSEQEVIDCPSQIIISTKYSHPNSIIVQIADNGLGMTEEVKRQLFEPFFTTKPVGKGTGLGLSISYQIVVDKHQGSLWCKSELGQGTEFRIVIPVKQEVRQSTSVAASIISNVAWKQ